MANCVELPLNALSEPHVLARSVVPMNRTILFGIGAVVAIGAVVIALTAGGEPEPTATGDSDQPLAQGESDNQQTDQPADNSADTPPAGEQVATTPETPEATDACTATPMQALGARGIATTFNGVAVPDPFVEFDGTIVVLNTFDMTVPIDGGPTWIWLNFVVADSSDVGNQTTYIVANDSRAVHGPPHPDASPFFVSWDAATNSTTGMVELIIDEFTGGQSQGKVTEVADVTASHDGTDLVMTVTSATTTLELIAEQPPTNNGTAYSSPECYLEAIGELRELDNPG